MTGVTVTKDDVQVLLGNIKAMSRKQALIGIPAVKSPRDGKIGNAALGYIHENGSPKRNIPARPFLVPAVREVSPKVVKIMKEAAEKGMDDVGAVDKGLNAAGLLAQAAVKNWMRKGEGFAPLLPRTIDARKRQGAKGTKPLIRTGQLLNSITYVVTDGND